VRVDLHVHTALSACAENTMSPAQIVARASAAGIDMLAVTDHNASANVDATIALGQAMGLRIVPGMEVTTREEAHVLALFDQPEALFELQTVIDDALPEEENLVGFFGMQLVYSDDDEISDVDGRLRQVGADLGLESIVCEIRKLGGCVVPSHVFRRRHSLTSQLGFVPEGADFDAVEVSRRVWVHDGYRLGQTVAGYPAVTASDAHFLEDVGRHSMDLPGSFETVAQVLGAVRELAG